MTLGAALYAPPATATQSRAWLEGSKARVSGKPVTATRTGGRLRVRALRDEESKISSIRDDHENLFQRIFDWGRHQMLKLFSGTRRMNSSAELADGSLLISFGEVTSTASVPARPPSRFSKQLPYSKVAKQLDPLTSTSNEVTLEQRKLPPRVPSTFSKMSPIARTSQRHRQRQKKNPSSPAEEQCTDSVTGFQDIQETLTEKAASRRSRPNGLFVRKSPVPQATKHRDRRRKGKTEDPKEQQQEQAGTKPRYATETTDHVASTEQGDGEQSGGKAEEVFAKDMKTSEGEGEASPVQQLVSALESNNHQFHEAEKQEQHGPKQAEAEEPKQHTPKQAEAEEPKQHTSNQAEAEEPKHRSRPRGVFVRKSPISAESLLKSSSRRRKMKAATDAQVNQAAVVVAEVAVVKEEAKVLVTEVETKPVRTTRIEATVEEAEELTVEAKSTRRRRKVLMESEFECSDIEEVDGSIDHDVDLASLTIARLRGIAKSKGLRGYSRLKKAELVALLLNQQ